MASRKRYRAPWVKGSMFQRQLGLVRWLAREDRWVSTIELAEEYGATLSDRRKLHRDLQAMRRSGLPIEWEEGWWRLRKKALLAFIKRVD